MPQLLFFAAVGVAAYVGYRSFLKEAERVTARLQRQKHEKATGTQGTLVKDPATGEYYLSKD